jgi:hypothetical protein
LVSCCRELFMLLAEFQVHRTGLQASGFQATTAQANLLLNMK